MSPARAGLLVLAALSGALGASAQAPPRRFLGGEVDQDAILEQMTTGYPRELRQVGTSSVTLRMELGTIRVAYKPRTDAHPRGYLSEIAAYRIARRLGMDNVPPVRGRRLPRTVLEDSLQADERWDVIREEIRWDAPGVARGAAIYWIPAMRSSELSSEAGVDAVASWLVVDGELPDRSSALARDLSTMFAFDYLIGNWDRLSGGNVSTTAEGDRLFVRDHNVAFSSLESGRYERLRDTLQRVQRFSRSFVEAVRALDEGALRAALAEDPEATERDLLNPEQLAAVLDRRRALLSYVAALVAVHGADRVLYWP